MCNRSKTKSSVCTKPTTIIHKKPTKAALEMYRPYAEIPTISTLEKFLSILSQFLFPSDKEM
jgi:hypothetical protein